MELLFSDDDSDATTSTTLSSAPTGSEKMWRTDSDYDNAWFLGLVEKLDAHIQKTTTPEDSLALTWVALRNTLAIQQENARYLRTELELTKSELRLTQQAQDNFTKFVLRQIETLSSIEED